MASEPADHIEDDVALHGFVQPSGVRLAVAGQANRESKAGEPGLKTALILVANPVTNDSRVFREADTLRDLGFDVLIAGVTTEQEPLRDTHVDGYPVIRLTRLGALRRWTRGSVPQTSNAGGARGETGAAASRRAGAFAAVRRLAWAAAFYLQGVALVRRTSPHLVHANDYNTMWIGVTAKLLRQSRLVYDAHELWPDRNGRPEWRPWLLVCEWLFVRFADATVTVSPGVADTMAKRYRIPPPVVVRNVSRSVVASPPTAEGLRAGAEPLAVYVGALAPGRGIEQAIRALALAPKLRLRLMGPVSDRYHAHLAQCAATAGVENRIEYRPAVEPTAVAQAIAGADMGLALIQPICLSYELSLPTKLFEYTAAGLPVIASDLLVLGTLVRDERIGEAVAPADVDAIAQAMRRLSEPTRNAEIRERVHSFGERNTWQQEQRVLEDVYTSLARSAGSGRRGRASDTHR